MNKIHKFSLTVQFNFYLQSISISLLLIGLTFNFCGDRGTEIMKFYSKWHSKQNIHLHLLFWAEWLLEVPGPQDFWQQLSPHSLCDVSVQSGNNSKDAIIKLLSNKFFYINTWGSKFSSLISIWTSSLTSFSPTGKYVRI